MQNFENEKFRRTLMSRIKAAVPFAIKARLIRKDGLIPTAARVWDQEFVSGRWDYLGKVGEMPRYAVIAGYYRASPANDTVLDVGCGTGILQPWLERVGYGLYRGVDLSVTAIEQAQRCANQTTHFEVANAETYVPPRTFDVIIFNEMLYYMTDPVRELRRYSQYLAPKGTYIISLWECRESWRVWHKCRTRLTLLDETRIGRGGLSWRIRLCQPAA